MMGSYYQRGHLPKPLKRWIIEIIIRDPQHQHHVSPIQDNFTWQPFAKTIDAQSGHRQGETNYEEDDENIVGRGCREAVGNMMQTGFDTISFEIEEAFFRFQKNIFTDMAHAGTLDNLINLNLRQWKKFPNFI